MTRVSKEWREHLTKIGAQGGKAGKGKPKNRPAGYYSKMAKKAAAARAKKKAQQGT